MNRRGFLTGLAAIAAPAIVPIGSLMPVRGLVMDVRGPVVASMDVNGYLTVDMVRAMVRAMQANGVPCVEYFLIQPGKLIPC